MVSVFEYRRIDQYIATVTCEEPLYVGAADGDGMSVLVHPVDRKPFVQASSIAGIFRACYKMLYGDSEDDVLFGSISDGGNSRIRFTDGRFLENPLLEHRPRLQMDPETGTVKTGKTGGKFDVELIGKGAKFRFVIYIYEKDVSYKEKLCGIFESIQGGQIQFGGQKSNGCGYLSVNRLQYKSFDMLDPEDRRRWAEEDGEQDKKDRCPCEEKDGEQDKKDRCPCEEEDVKQDEYDTLIISGKKAGSSTAYDITVRARTENWLQVKARAVMESGADVPDSVNIQNAKGDYIVPGSSLKGALRNRMQWISDYLHLNGVMENAFGGEKQAGNIRVRDVLVGEKEKNAQASIEHRIHIDKFTGGVIYKGLFSERNVFGNTEMRIFVMNYNEPKRSCALLLYALRDLAIGGLNIGSGYGVGKGFFQVEDITILRKSDNAQAKIIREHKKFRVEDEGNVITDCLKDLKDLK